MPPLMSAREYYFSVVAPEEEGKSYWEYHQRGKAWDIAKPDSPIASYSPDLSNDWLLDHLLHVLSAKAAPSIASRLQGVFVAKRHDLHAEAYTSSWGSQDFAGDLVFFHVGLSDACFQYSTLYAWLQELMLLSERLGNEHPTVMAHYIKLIRESLKLAVVQANWRAFGDYIKLEKEFMVDTSSRDVAERGGTIATFTDSFILGHEIAHHLLGHCGREDVGTPFVNELPAHLRFWERAGTNHRKELQADALALLLAAGATPYSHPVGNSQINEFFRAAMGALLTITVIGQASGGPNRSSLTHPSPESRFEQCLAIAESNLPSGVFRNLEADFDKLQALFLATQGHGFSRVGNHEVKETISYIVRQLLGGK